jgi:carbon storage regulator
MLILSRRPGDAILIDGGIRIIVLAADQRTVRIGIEAPSKIGIVREEIALPVDGAPVSAGSAASRPPREGAKHGKAKPAAACVPANPPPPTA